MRKQVFGRHFSRSRKAREALFKSLIKTIILHGKIETTYAKAKAIQGDIDEMVGLAKKGGVSAFREISSALSADRKMVAKLVGDATSFKERTSGFTRIVRLPARFGDAAQMARLEWTDQIEVPKVSKVPQVSKVKKVKKERKEKAELRSKKKSKGVVKKV